MKMQVLVVLIVMLVSSLPGGTSDDPKLPDIWTVVEDSYETDVLVTFDSLGDDGYGATMYVQEYYEISEEKGVVHILDHSNYQKINYYHESEQMFIEHQKKVCEVGGLIDHPGYVLWGWDFYTGAEGENFLYGPSALLRIPKIHQGTYISDTSIRGTDVNLFRVKMDNYTIEYYFAKDDWTMPYGKVLDGKNLKSPLQVIVKGVQENPWSGHQEFKDMSVTYDYIIFRPKLRDDDETFYTFKLSTGLDCKGRKSLKPDIEVPKLPYYFQTSVEVVIRRPEVTVVARSKIYYDYYNRLVRIDHNEDSDINEASSSKDIHDFNTGISYSINTLTGSCDMQPLDPSQFGNAIGSDVIGDVILGDPDSIFHFDDSYIFSGLYESEGKLVNRFTSVRDDISNGEGGTYQKVVIDFDFSEWSVKHPGEDEAPPERMKVTIFDDNNSTEIVREEYIYFLGFTAQKIDERANHFDIRDCFSTPQDRTWIKIYFEGDYDLGMREQQDKFRQDFIDKITEEGKISAIRIPEINIDHDEKYTYVIMLLLQPAPYLLQFKAMEDHKPTDDDYKYPMAINDDDSCAEQCLRYTKFKCKSFYECVGTGYGCYLSNYVQPHGNEVNVPKVCGHYKKVLANNTLPIPDRNRQFEGWLQTEILREELVFDYYHTFDNGTTIVTTYIGKAFEEELVGDDPIFVDIIKSDFKPTYSGAKLKLAFIDFQPLRSSFLQCVSGCEEMKSFECESFAFCSNDKSCYLTQTIYERPVSDDNIVLQRDCNIYTRRHLDDYLRFDGYVAVTDVKQTINMVEDPNQCAFDCDEVTDFTCRSFDYCHDELICYLHTTRAIDSNDTSLVNNSACTHYSRDFLVDFDKHENIKISGTRDHYITDASTRECAMVCEQEPEYKCVGFDFCNNEESVICYLSEQYYSDDGVSVVDEPNCDHYSREYYDGNSRPPPTHKTGKTNPYNSGDMAALGVSMLIISIAATFGGVYAYNKFYKK